jgi:Domain of unknown function (DUF4157)
MPSAAEPQLTRAAERAMASALQAAALASEPAAPGPAQPPASDVRPAPKAASEASPEAHVAASQAEPPLAVTEPHVATTSAELQVATTLAEPEVASRVAGAPATAVRPEMHAVAGNEAQPHTLTRPAAHQDRATPSKVQLAATQARAQVSRTQRDAEVAHQPAEYFEAHEHAEPLARGNLAERTVETAPPQPAIAHPRIATSTASAERTDDTPSATASHLDEPVSPEQVSQVTRDFLRPLVGIDPSDVQVYRGEEASHAASQHNADAITVEDSVYVAHGQAHEGVHGAALLAHELTHVARQREPGFLPPVARHTLPAAQQDEETLAREVESAVHQAARAAGPGEWGGLPAPWEPLPAWLTTPEAGTPGNAPTSAQAISPAGSATDTSSASDSSGLPSIGLASSAAPSSAGSSAPGGSSGTANSTPATSGSGSIASASSGTGNSGPSSSGPGSAAPSSGPSSSGPGLMSAGLASAGTGGGGMGGGAAMGGVMAAEHGRALDAGADVTHGAAGDQEQQEQQQHGHQAGVEPDLDALARQVYARLKRRLAAEQRRLS